LYVAFNARHDSQSMYNEFVKVNRALNSIVQPTVESNGQSQLSVR